MMEERRHRIRIVTRDSRNTISSKSASNAITNTTRVACLKRRPSYSTAEQYIYKET
jgi:hypothetical protein